jgi:MSHA pilin protein MshD
MCADPAVGLGAAPPRAARCRRNSARLHGQRQRTGGLTLIELIVFILVVSIGLAAVLLAINTGIKHSADPMVRKQALAAAESLLEEVAQQPFTFCDPRDTQAASATSALTCNQVSYSMDNPANWGIGKVRYGPEFFNNVADYHNFSMTGTLVDLLQQASSRLAGYGANVQVTQAGAQFSLPNADVLRVDVTVTGSGESVTLSGFRFRHSPNLIN